MAHHYNRWDMMRKSLFIIFVFSLILMACAKEDTWTLLKANKADILPYKVKNFRQDKRAKTGFLIQARLLVYVDKLSEPTAKAIAADFIEKNKSMSNAMMFSVVGVRKTKVMGDIIEIPNTVYSVRWAGSSQGAQGLYRPEWIGGQFPRIEFKKE